MRKCFALVLAIAAGSTAVCQQASFSTFGQGCGVYGEPPRPLAIWGSGVPRLGSTVTVGFTGPSFGTSLASMVPTLIAGLSRTSSNGVGLPYHLDWNLYQWMGGPDCNLYCSSEVFTRFAGTWTGQVTMAIPLDRRLLGLPIYQQFYVSYLVTGQTILGFAVTSDCGVWTIGL